MTLYRHAEELAAAVARLTRERDASMEALRVAAQAISSAHGQVEDTHDQIQSCRCILAHPYAYAKRVIHSIETGAIHDQR